MIMFLSSMGLPLLNGFVGSSRFWPCVYRELEMGGVGYSRLVLAAAYLLWLYQRVFFGPVYESQKRKAC